MSIPDSTPAPADGAPVLDTKVRRKRLYADPRVIAFGRKSMALAEVEWVGYSAIHTTTHRLLTPASHDGQWDFVVGKYPYYGGPQVIVHFYEPGRSSAPPPEWVFLMNLAAQYVEPRLLAELIDQVRRGETVTVGGSVKVDKSGISCPKPRMSLPWGSVGGARPYNGMVWIYQTGVEKPVLSVPLSHPNAGLIPDLFAAFTS
ncbi:hypothetical protein [Glycomyces tenuis]|uniref:hypothetical protein n=1 Tax=Glycomyces tenuis TaxID=58116 RepID=UPI0004238CA0|nr:hypothetical protein [Glycomyces tenuis]